MSANNPEAGRTTQSSALDAQTLIGLLDGLMPLLLQLQSQPQPYGGQPGFAPTDPALLFGTVAPPNPLLDHQAAAEMIEGMNACALRTLSSYLESYAGQAAALSTGVGMVTQAARAFAVRDHAQTFALIWQTYRAIASARIQDPQLPPVQVDGADPLRSSSASTLH